MRMKEDTKLEVIICPNCGCEYLPSEIYYPKSFFGTPTNIERLANGKIDTFVGKNVDYEETYICDKCSQKFRVNAKVAYKTECISKHDMSKAYVTNLFEDKLTLDENF